MSKKKRTPAHKPQRVTFDADEWIPVAHNREHTRMFVMLSPLGEDGLSRAQLKVESDLGLEGIQQPLMDMVDELSHAAEQMTKQIMFSRDLAHTIDVILKEMAPSDIAIMKFGLDIKEAQVHKVLKDRLEAIRDEARTKVEAMSDDELRTYIKEVEADHLLTSIANNEQQRRNTA